MNRIDEKLQEYLNLDFFLYTEIGESLPQCIELGNSEYVLGKETSSDLVFNKDMRAISRKHATIKYRDGNYNLIDNSTVGTWINGMKILQGKEFPLRIGDRINIGSEETVLLFGGIGRGTADMIRVAEPSPEIQVDVEAMKVTKQGFNAPELNVTQFDVLSKLWINKGMPVPYERLWEVFAKDINDDGDDALKKKRVVDVIGQLRDELERLGRKGPHFLIQTRAGIGYQMAEFRHLNDPPFASEWDG